MKKNTIVIVIAILAFVTIVSTFSITRTQSQTENKQTSQRSENEVPTVNINKLELTNPQEKELRNKRGQKYSQDEPVIEDNKEAGKLLELPLSHASAKKALPTVESDAVIIGTVTDAQAFLSNEKTNIYSEFNVQVETTLKNSSKVALYPNVEITAERIGGAVRYSNGKTQQRGNAGEDLPRKQGRYVLFLKWSEEGKDFLIITGYKLENGKVTPLDGEGFNADSVYKNFKLYRNYDENGFLKKLKDEIANPSPDEPKTRIWLEESNK